MSRPSSRTSPNKHVVYTLLLVRAYEHGDLSVAYPVARGTAPLLVTLGAAAFAGEHLNVGAQCGLVLICAGILAIGLERGRGAKHRMMQVLPTAFATGVSIAAYSVVDGIGVRESGNTVGYTAWTRRWPRSPRRACARVSRSV